MYKVYNIKQFTNKDTGETFLRGGLMLEKPVIERFGMHIVDHDPEAAKEILPRLDLRWANCYFPGVLAETLLQGKERIDLIIDADLTFRETLNEGRDGSVQIGIMVYENDLYGCEELKKSFRVNRFPATAAADAVTEEVPF